MTTSPGAPAGDPPGVGLPNQVRREQTQRALARVTAAIETWFALRKERDKDLVGQYAGLHETRLNTLATILRYGLETLAADLGKVDVDSARDRRQVYAECRRIDQALVWMERVWGYYREKFDQRDDASLAPLLQAAEEVIWSCYSQVFANRNHLPKDLTQAPAPLAYLDAQYSPATWEAAKLSPSDLRDASTVEGLESFLQTLPVPVLRLPTWCIDAPWTLVFVAHEVGHNVQRELGLVRPFEELLKSACLEQPGPDRPNPERWKAWASEIFADLFSVAMVGESAVRALREIQLGPPTEMNKPQSGYPVPAVRLKLVACAADRLQLGGSQALAGLDIDELGRESPITQADLKMVGPILDKALGPLSDQVGPLEKLCGLDGARADLVKAAQFWGGSLLKTPTVPTRSLQAPRFIACGAWHAWEQATRLATPDERRSALEQLATNTVDILRKSGPPGTRAKPPAPTDLESHGVSLARRLLQASRGQESEDAGT
jgi:hypothetical protein